MTSGRATPPLLKNLNERTVLDAIRSYAPDSRAEIVRRVERALDGAARVGFPAGLGAEDPHGVWTALQEALGRPVFEVPTLPPSVPGMRVFKTLRARLRENGGRIVLNSMAVGAVLYPIAVETSSASAMRNLALVRSPAQAVTTPNDER